MGKKVNKKLTKKEKQRIRHLTEMEKFAEAIASKKIFAIKSAKYDEELKFTDGRVIKAYHEADCCEQNYADWGSLFDTGFFEENFFGKKLVIDEWEGGFRINGYAVNCYSEQNGYYSSDITVEIYNPTSDKPFYKRDYWCEVLED